MSLVDGELRGWQVGRVRRHVARCANCQQELAELEALNKQLRSATPLPARKPVRRPMGLVRPAFATLALASVAVFLVARVSEPEAVPTKPGPESPPPRGYPIPPPAKRAEPAPRSPSVASAQPRVKTQRKRIVHRVARRKSKTYQRPLAVAKIAPTKTQDPEQVIIIASAVVLPDPVTIVLNDRDDEGGTIHIESTIPAAYVVAMQKETK
jgi:hypothetical protein